MPAEDAQADLSDSEIDILMETAHDEEEETEDEKLRSEAAVFLIAP